MAEQYIQSSEILYFVDRLDRFSPLTSKFISCGPSVVTPMTQKELVSIILGDQGDDKVLCTKRGLPPLQIGPDVKDVYRYLSSDNNHSIYWKAGFVHAIGRQTTYWNLDADFRDVLSEAFRVDESIGSDVIRDYVYDIIESDEVFTAVLSENTENVFMHWLDEQRAKLPPAPDPDNYDSAVSDRYYAALNALIFYPLREIQDFNQDIIDLVSARAENDDHFRDMLLRNVIVEYVFPKNEQADGYVIEGHRALLPADALRGAIYVGNVYEALKFHSRGEQFLNTGIDIELMSKVAYAANKDLLNQGRYPEHMFRGMASDWITDGPFTKGNRKEPLRYIAEEDALDLAFSPKKEYPQFGGVCLLEIGCDVKELEGNAVVSPANWDELEQLRRAIIVATQTPRLDPIS